MSAHPRDHVHLQKPQLISAGSKQSMASFYTQRSKRILDVVCSAVALLLTLPLLALAAAAVKLTSPGPVLFRQKRVGKGGEVFDILKFRSMRVDAEKWGPQITSAGDQRVTAVGRLLRRTKFDEFPQFWNVLKGDMSLVGPRPEVPRYVAMYTDEQRSVLSVRPGITDFATVMYRHEERLLGQQPDPEQFYVNVLMPHKLALNLKYISRMSLLTDIRLLFLTAMATFRGTGY